MTSSFVELERDRLGRSVARGPAAATFVLATSGRATLIDGTHRSLEVDSTPDRMRVTVEPGGLELVPPGCGRVERNAVHRLRFDPPDYEPPVETVYRQSGGLTLLNLPTFGLVGIDEALARSDRAVERRVDRALGKRRFECTGALRGAGSSGVTAALSRGVSSGTRVAGRPGCPRCCGRPRG
ncbi:MAG: hypothetical protein R3F35_06980 [Myxococcota bacterium]